MWVHAATARALLVESGLPTRLWAEAMRFSVWLHNRSFTTAVEDKSKTPIELATGSIPDLSLLSTWGTKILVKDLKAGKLGVRTVEG
ncbi:hypothetical protein FA15DRAFT_596422, partial [Coprinopsis marcescibilis]